MKKFWRIVIGVGMVIFGIIGLLSSLLIENKQLETPGIIESGLLPGAVKTVPKKQEQLVEKEQTSSDKETKNTTETESVSPSPTSAYTDKQKVADRELFRELVKDRAVERCNELINNQLQTSCQDSIRLALALRDNSLGTCDLIQNQEQKTECRDHVLLAKATEDNEYELCPEIMSSTLRTRCQEAEARRKITEVANINDCEKIESRKERSMCFDFFAAKHAAANMVTEGADACGVISDADLRSNCLVTNAIRLAGIDKNINPCRELEDKELQTICIRKVGAELQAVTTAESISTGDVEGCEGVSEADGKQYCINTALYTKAINEHSPKLCQGIMIETRQQKCVDEATKAESNYYFRMAKDEQDIKWCRLISNQSAQESCLSVITKMTQGDS